MSIKTDDGLRFVGLRSFTEKGFALIKFTDEMQLHLKRLRVRFFRRFSLAGDFHVLRATQDKIVEMYSGPSRDAWVSAYDQLRYVPEVYEIAGSDVMRRIADVCGIKKPALAARPIVRCDMPDDPEYEFDQHQDYTYNLGSLNSVTIWIPFQDTPEELGALKVIPGSHKWGLLDTKDDGTLKEKRPEEEFETVEVDFGWALVFSQFLVHKSGHNTTDHGVRFSQQIRFNDLAHPEYLERGWPVNEEISRKKLYADFDAEYRA